MRATEELTFGTSQASTERRLAHYLFRYPAKFHPPVVRELLSRYTDEGQLVLDPFVGSGTLLVEARTMNRSSIGVDVDPVAVLVSSAKSHRYQPNRLLSSIRAVEEALTPFERPESEYKRMVHEDLFAEEYENERACVRDWIPHIPNLLHWFRRYVIIDLAHIRQTIAEADVADSHRLFLNLVLGSIIRNVSNADPVPVSGLEVTAHMRRRDVAGRLINPFQMFRKAAAKAHLAAASYWNEAAPSATVQTIRGDATDIAALVNGRVDAVITSPPYHGAVDYYRRHQLEMYWLGLTESQADRLSLLQHYIGRPTVPKSHRLVGSSPLPTALAKDWEDRIRATAPDRADAFHHYMAGMTEVFEGLGHCVKPSGALVLVVGHSTWNSSHIPTTELFEEIAGADFTLHQVMSYKIKNRYMSYARHNGASIDREFVLQLRKK